MPAVYASTTASRPHPEEMVAASSLVYFFTRYVLSEKKLIGAFVFFVSTCLFYFTRFIGLLMNYSDLDYSFETAFQTNHRVVD